jgi:hypothetical protein
VDMKFEVAVVPVTDVDRAKACVDPVRHRRDDDGSWLCGESVPDRGGPRGGQQADTAALAGLLQETAGRHGAFERVAPPHDWWDWYAAYMDAREDGSTPEAASAAAGRYMADVKHVVV